MHGPAGDSKVFRHMPKGSWKVSKEPQRGHYGDEAPGCRVAAYSGPRAASRGVALSSYEIRISDSILWHNKLGHIG